MRSFLRRRHLAAASFVAAVGWGGRALADEPVGDKEPPLLSETAEVTSVVDAFDGADPFDLHFLVGFAQQWKNANIRRETNINAPGLSSGNFVARTENIATFSQATSTVNLGMDVGIYKDFALIIRLPIIVSDSRQLGDLNGSSAVAAQLLADPVNGTPLFNVPFKSPTRSGIDWFSVGLDYAIFNQQRDATKPTWVIGAAGRFAVGPSLHACNGDANTNAGQFQCPNLDGSPGTRDPGISRAMHGVEAHTVFSRRFGYVEPYMGFWFLAEFPRGAGSDDFANTNNFDGALVNHPPLLGTFSTGVEIVPYEQREAFRRFIIDLRAKGTYHSPGREYTELFDALGSSPAPSLRSANPGGYTGTGCPPGVLSCADPTKQQAYFSGITDQQAFISVGGQTSITWQAGERIKFQIGAGLTWNQSHLITSADACNPGASFTVATAGPCQLVQGSTITPTGLPNPNHRPVIDLPGNRFSADDTTIVNLWVNGVVMF